MTSHETDQVAAHSASMAVRRRPAISRRATSWPPTIAAVLAAYAQPSARAGMSATVTAYAASPASICA